MWAPALGASGVALGLSTRLAKKHMSETLVPRMGVLSAFIFAAQLINIPTPVGLSWHLVGCALAVAVIGPAAAILCMSLVLIVQALLLQDGGVVALGANIFNMAVCGSLAAWLCIKLGTLAGKSNRSFIIAIAVGSWLSVVVTSFFVGLELWLSGYGTFFSLVAGMTGVYAILGIGEAVLTGLMISYLLKMRPDIIIRKEKSSGPED